MENLPENRLHGIQTVLQIPLKIIVKEGSFLHIGGSPSPLIEEKAPVFSIDGILVIPTFSFKSAFRYQVEKLLMDKKDEFKSKIGITDDELIQPCIPALRPSRAEQELLKLGYRKQCEIKAEEDKVDMPEKGICSVCYFFGATGLMGFLRMPNFCPVVGEYKIEQTSIRIDRESGAAVTGAIATGEQVKPGAIFKGILEIVAQQRTFQFGVAREIGGTKVDLWMDRIDSKPIEEARLLLINEILTPTLNNINVLGSQKSKGAGKITVEISN